MGSQNISVYINQRTLFKTQQGFCWLSRNFPSCQHNFFSSGGNQSCIHLSDIFYGFSEHEILYFFQLFHSVSPEVVQCISTVKIAQVCYPFPYLVGQCTSTFVLVIGSLSLRKPLHLTYWISGGTSSLVCLSSKTSDTYRNWSYICSHNDSAPPPK